MSRKIGIIGSGIVGETLANGFIKHGYQVTIGTNTAGKRDELRARTNGQAIVGTFEDAASFGEVVAGDEGKRGSRGASGSGHCTPCRQDGDRYLQSDRGHAAGQGRAEGT